MITPTIAPGVPSEWWEFTHISSVNGENISRALGLSWLRKSRITLFHHLGLISLMKIMVFMIRNKNEINEKMKLFGEQKELYGKFDK